MSHTLDPVEQAMVLECLREVRARLKLGKAKQLANRLSKVNAEINEQTANDCISRKSISRPSQALIASAALEILREHYSIILEHYDRSNKTVAAHLSQIFIKYKVVEELEPHGVVEDPRTKSSAGPGAGYAEIIFSNWLDTFRKGDGVLETGVYQMFRRYKATPDSAGGAGRSSRASRDLSNQAIICELIYVDSDAMECVMVTSERNLYFGTIFINHEDILYGLLQRRTRDSGVNQRVITVRLGGSRLPMYSGLCLKTGDTTRRPLAAACLYVRCSQSDHPEMYAEFEAIRRTPWTGKKVSNVAKDSAIYDYITLNPRLSLADPEWNRVKKADAFPQLASLMHPNKAGVTYLQDSLRTMSFEDLVRIGGELSLPVFRHSNTAASGTSVFDRTSLSLGANI